MQQIDPAITGAAIFAGYQPIIVIAMAVLVAIVYFVSSRRKQ